MRRALIDAVARRFRPSGVFAELFARGKLAHDPLYLGLLEHAVIPNGARVLDLGCGQALLLCLLAVSSGLRRAGIWPLGWPAPPETLRLAGIERSPIAVRRARLALAADGAIEERDLRFARLPSSDLITLLDVVHYLEPEAQDRLLERIAAALSPGGMVLMRVCADGSGSRARFTRATDRFGALTRGHFVWQLHARSVAAWLAALERLGLRATAEPASQGTPFANVLITARRAG
ncbi:MAG: methyltransferase domain-containing protein [Myxococcota bacterium]